MGLEDPHVGIGGAEDDREAAADAERLQLQVGRVVRKHPDLDAVSAQKIEERQQTLRTATRQILQRALHHPFADDGLDPLDRHARAASGDLELTVGTALAGLSAEVFLRFPELGEHAPAHRRLQRPSERQRGQFQGHQRPHGLLAIERAVQIEQHRTHTSLGVHRISNARRRGVGRVGHDVFDFFSQHDPTSL